MSSDDVTRISVSLQTRSEMFREMSRAYTVQCGWGTFMKKKTVAPRISVIRTAQGQSYFVKIEVGFIKRNLYLSSKERNI